jgi:lipopolysaccharide export system ATP-binding protein
VNDTATISRPDRDAAFGQVSRGLSVVSIAKSYDRKSVLNDVSLGVNRGEVVGLLGRTARARRPASIRSWGW